MTIENRFKTRLSRFFSSSLGSCGSQNLSDIIRKAVVSPKNKKGIPIIEPLSPKCPAKEFDQFGTRKIENHAKKTSKKKKSRNVELCPLNSFSHSQDTNFNGWFSSEDETETFFSSKSVSSASLELPRRGTCPEYRVARRERVGKSFEKGRDISLHGKVKDSFAVTKQSSDPYSDFRTSMVEMIVEKQIVGAEELEQLLQCFLSLNLDCYHRVIIEVFIEICETLMHNS